MRMKHWKGMCVTVVIPNTIAWIKTVINLMENSTDIILTIKHIISYQSKSFDIIIVESDIFELLHQK